MPRSKTKDELLELSRKNFVKLYGLVDPYSSEEQVHILPKAGSLFIPSSGIAPLRCFSKPKITVSRITGEFRWLSSSFIRHAGSRTRPTTGKNPIVRAF